MSWKIELGNGRKLTGLELSGDTFLSDEALTKGDFDGGLKNVKIESTEPDEFGGTNEFAGVHELMELTVLQKVGRKVGFTLRDVEKPGPDSLEALRADVDYLLMMREE